LPVTITFNFVIVVGNPLGPSGWTLAASSVYVSPSAANNRC